MLNSLGVSGRSEPLKLSWTADGTAGLADVLVS